MNPDPGSLENLRDLALPPAVSFWPPAPGVWIIGAAIAAMALVMLFSAVSRHKANAFRRAAIAELFALARTGDGASAEEASAIMKRAAIVAFGRDKVAALTGRAWADFVCRSAPSDIDQNLVRRSLGRAFDGHHETDAAEFAGQAKRWIAHLEATEGKRPC